jgi:hypothetical protein
MATHPDDQIRMSVRATRPSSTVPREGKWRIDAIDETQAKLDLLNRQAYLEVRDRMRDTGIVVSTMDASGRVLQLPENAIIMDCCNCKRAMVRDKNSLPLWAQPIVQEYGGSEDDGTGHHRPYCRECYD